VLPRADWFIHFWRSSGGSCLDSWFSILSDHFDHHPKSECKMQTRPNSQHTKSNNSSREFNLSATVDAMKTYTFLAAASAVWCSTSARAYTLTVASLRHQGKAVSWGTRPPLARNVAAIQPFAPLLSSASYNDQVADADDQASAEISRLRSMAAKLRAEAAALESAKQAETLAATERAFASFDLDVDGTVSLAELKSGLERNLKMTLSEARVQQMMQKLDKSGDGVLKLSEFVTVAQMRWQLEALIREEKHLAREAAKQAAYEAEIEAQLDLVNNRPPTATDKLVSILPYLFPLLDGLYYAVPFLLKNLDTSLLVYALGSLFVLFHKIPYGGLLAFFALSALSSNMRVNRLVRFNMHQAILLDISLFFPRLASSLFGLLVGDLVSLGPQLEELYDTAIFGVLAMCLGYSVISSVAGLLPDKIPLISEASLHRMDNTSFEIVPFDSKNKNQERKLISKQKQDEKDQKDEE
jgi:Chloroplast import apparatus Tic20-like/EF-hand domain pair